MVKTFESNAPVRGPKQNPFLLLDQARTTDSPITCSILSARNLSNFRSSDTEITEVATMNRASTDLPDGNISKRKRNSSQGLLKSDCSLPMGTYNVHALDQIMNKLPKIKLVKPLR